MIPRPTLASQALQWPALEQSCVKRHETPTHAVVSGTNRDGAVALCIACACADAWFTPDDGRPMPDQMDLIRAMDALEAVEFDGDVVGWPRPIWVRPEPSATSNGACPATHDDGSSPDEDVVETLPRLPVPWINGESGLKGDFYTFRPDALRSVENRLCAVCGTHMSGDIALGSMNGKRITSGGWCHPRCLAVAVRMCPHFTRNAASSTIVVGWRYRGPGVGLVDVDLVEDPVAPCALPLTLTDLTDWARRDPWGHEGLDRQAVCGCPPQEPAGQQPTG